MTGIQASRKIRTLMCPSAEPDMHGSIIFGIVAGTAEQPEVVHLPEVKQIPPELLTLDSPIRPTEIFRVAATCIQNACKHFDGSQCRLVNRIVDGLPPSAESLPPCPIRTNCRWWNQQGKSACLRCSQVVRDNFQVSEELYQAINTDVYQD